MFSHFLFSSELTSYVCIYTYIDTSHDNDNVSDSDNDSGHARENDNDQADLRSNNKKNKE